MNSLFPQYLFNHQSLKCRRMKTKMPSPLRLRCRSWYIKVLHSPVKTVCVYFLSIGFLSFSGVLYLQRFVGLDLDWRWFVFSICWKLKDQFPPMFASCAPYSVCLTMFDCWSLQLCVEAVHVWYTQIHLPVWPRTFAFMCFFLLAFVRYVLAVIIVVYVSCVRFILTTCYLLCVLDRFKVILAKSSLTHVVLLSEKAASPVNSGCILLVLLKSVFVVSPWCWWTLPKFWWIWPCQMISIHIIYTISIYIYIYHYIIYIY